MDSSLLRLGLACLPLYMAGAVMAALGFMVMWGSFFLASGQSVLYVLSLTFAVLLGALGTQFNLGRAAGILVRIIWLLMAGFGVFLTWFLFPFFQEAAHHIVLARAGQPAQDAWSATARPMTVYFVLAALIWSVSGTLVARAIAFFRTDRRVGPTLEIAGDVAPGLLLGWWRALRGQHADSRPAHAPQPQMDTGGWKEPPLATRDHAAVSPRLTFADLDGNAEIKKKLLAAAIEWDNSGRKDGKNGIFLFGEPGTGKTAFAEALAGEMRLRIIKANVGSVASRWVNQTTEQFLDLIQAALAQAPCVLFLDEIDSLLPDRSSMNHSNAEENKVVGAFLSAVEKLRQNQVLYIAATNYKDRLDPAAIREGRFDFHLEMPLPDFAARKGLVRAVLAKANKSVEETVLDRLCQRWAGFNVPRIMEAARRAAKMSSGKSVRMRDFMRALREVQGNRAGPPEAALPFSQLYFDDSVKDRLTELAATFAHVEEIEARGGSIPKGIIFFGPPGTGKTSMAQALAKEAGWTFIGTSGKEIASDPERLRQIRREASDLRPAIVFIDEADDILGDRGHSGLKLHTNDLLRSIDGAGEPLPDVCWILATNRPEELDEAVFRRFPVKLELGLPSRATLRRFILDWAATHRDQLDKDAEPWADEVVEALDGLAPSVVKNILQTALDGEAARSLLWDAPMSLCLDDVLKARKEMAL